MILIGLTGGIASGKSTVAELLRRKGAVIIDADRIGQETYLPGEPAYEEVLERFGEGVLAGDGTIDRTKLAAKVFDDPEALNALNSITHPRISEAIAGRVDRARIGDEVVVVDAALLVEVLGAGKRPDGFDALVVVAADLDDQMERMMRDRSMSEEAARGRLSAQASSEGRLAVADYVVDNRGTIQNLEASVDVLWELLTGGGVRETILDLDDLDL